MSDRIKTLVDRLHAKTKAGELIWDKTPSSNFQISFPNYTVELAENNLDYYLYIYNEEGDIVESVSDSEMRIYDSNAKLRELYELARRVALGSDEAVENLISALED